MKTFKTSRRFHGSPISLRALGRLEDRSLPLSVRDIVATDGFRHFSGEISTGDVECNWELNLWQNGFWSAKGNFYDDGTIAGDFFYVEFLLAGEHHSVGARIEGSILNVIESRHLSKGKEGSDRWIRENWHKFEQTGPTVRLHVAPAVGAVFLWTGVILAVAPVVAFAVTGKDGTTTMEVTRCKEQVDAFGTTGHEACIEIGVRREWR